jgi:hypothetical protein
MIPAIPAIPASARFPAPGELGPDPEPPSGERRARILARVEVGLAVPRDSKPRACPLERALGRATRCRGPACIYYRVPGVDGACAVMSWTGGRTPNRQLAGWFIARRREAASRSATHSSSHHRANQSKEEDR